MLAIQEIHLKDAERFLRVVMILTLLAAGVSKLFSGDGFSEYYSGLFANPSPVDFFAWEHPPPDWD